MKRLLIITALLFAGAIAADAQECPGVCITRQQAVEGLQNADKVKARLSQLGGNAGAAPSTER